MRVLGGSSQAIRVRRSIRTTGKQGSKLPSNTEKAACTDACFPKAIQHLGDVPWRGFVSRRTKAFEMVNVGPIQAPGGMQPINGPRLDGVKPRGAIPNSIPVDRVEISQIARLMSEVSSLPEVRAEKIAQVRAEIEAGTYITPEKVDIAVERMLEDLQI